MVGSRYFLLDPLKCFLPKMERKLSGDEFFLNWQKYPCACAHGLLQVAFFFYPLCRRCLFSVLIFFSWQGCLFFLLLFLYSFDFLGLGVPFFFFFLSLFFFFFPSSGLGSNAASLFIYLFIFISFDFLGPRCVGFFLTRRYFFFGTWFFFFFLIINLGDCSFCGYLSLFLVLIGHHFLAMVYE